ncbi:MAG: PD40 domain-containing protein, partial [Flavobacteriales bacterium]|nr:PD40 domain-containing protein [Flavobacteriales bacterium]
MKLLTAKRAIFFESVKTAFLLTFLLAGTSGYCQEEPKSFRELFTEGSFHMQYESFNLAVPVYLEAEKLEPTNSNIQYRIGYSYNRFSDDKSIAIPYLRKAITQTTRNYDDIAFTEKKAPLAAYFELAKAYHLSDQLDSAISNYTRYAAMIHKKHYRQKEIALQVAMCNYAKHQMANPVRVKITNMGEMINTEFGDYTPVVTAKENMMIFTSRRMGTGGKDNLEFDNRYFEDIYIAHKENGKWGQAEQIRGGINTTDHDAVISLSADGQKLFTYKAEGDNGDIFISYAMGDGWTLPDRLGPTINTPARETHASITPDGNKIFFSSDRAEKKAIQYGGLDLYMATKLPTGEWSEAVNLGAVINTAGDDDAPFIHPNGTRLYFSSKGHKSMGGYDIFYSDLQEDGTWSPPTNVGYPINTTKDDIYYVESPNGQRAYYSSVNTALGYGQTDLYMVEMPERPEIPLTMITGKMEIPIVDGIPMEAKIIVKDPRSGKETEYLPNSETGDYTIILPPGAEYEVTYKMEDSVIVTETLEEVAKSDYLEIEKIISMDGKIETKIIEKAPPPPPVQILRLLDAMGTTLSIATLNSDGVFVFENLPDMDNYLFLLDPTDGPMIEQNVRVLRTLDGKETILSLMKTEDGKQLTFERQPEVVEPEVVEPEVVEPEVIEPEVVEPEVVEPEVVEPEVIEPEVVEPEVVEPEVVEPEVVEPEVVEPEVVEPEVVEPEVVEPEVVEPEVVEPEVVEPEVVEPEVVEPEVVEPV